MNFMRKFLDSVPEDWAIFFLVVLIVVGAVLSLERFREWDTVVVLDTMKKDFEELSPALSNACRTWARENDHPTWLCGPTSYAVAERVNRKYFDNQLPIVLDRIPGRDCIQITLGVVYVPLGDGQYRVGDHVWIQIYWRGLIIMVDPTYSQLDNLDSIVFAWFRDNDEGHRELRTFLNLLRLQELRDSSSDDWDNRELYRAYLRDRQVLRAMFDSGGVPKGWAQWNKHIRSILK